MPQKNKEGTTIYILITISIVGCKINQRGDFLSLEEQKEVAINRYVDLMRIKAHETGENKELEYQIKVAKVKLASLGIDYSELEL